MTTNEEKSIMTNTDTRLSAPWVVEAAHEVALAEDIVQAHSDAIMEDIDRENGVHDDAVDRAHAVLTELAERLLKAARELDKLADTAVPNDDRLRGKASGVRLALSYLNETRHAGPGAL